MKEPTATARVATYLHEYGNGDAKIKTYTAVNGQEHTDNAARTTKVQGLTVKVNVEEDKTIRDNVIYEKAVKVKQENDLVNPSNSKTERDIPSQQQPSAFKKFGDGVMDKCDYLKNFLDKHIDTDNSRWNNHHADHRTKDIMYLIWGIIITAVLFIAFSKLFL